MSRLNATRRANISNGELLELAAKCDRAEAQRAELLAALRDLTASNAEGAWKPAYNAVQRGRATLASIEREMSAALRVQS